VLVGADDPARAALDPAGHVLARDNSAVAENPARGVRDDAAVGVERQARDRHAPVANRPQHHVGRQMRKRRAGRSRGGVRPTGAELHTGDVRIAADGGRTQPEAQVQPPGPALWRPLGPGLEHLQVAAATALPASSASAAASRARSPGGTTTSALASSPSSRSSFAVAAEAVYCSVSGESGQGQDWVVFEAGAGCGRTFWDPVQPLLAGAARLVAYDRAGAHAAAAPPSSSRASKHTYHSFGPRCSTTDPGSHDYRSRSPCSSCFERG
jgi:hypothetical protein